MKRGWKVAGIVLGVLTAILIILLLLVNYFFYNTNRLPEGELLTESVSPSGDYTVKAYLANGGATVAFAVRGEVIYHQKKEKKKNIYWAYRKEDAEITWIDEHTVSINGRKLDVRKDVYDWRKVK
ncbi:DUF5412 family protein [Sporosarcina sp. CAU 1771]